MKNPGSDAAQKHLRKMISQKPEKLIWRNNQFRMENLPLACQNGKREIILPFISPYASCARGYIGTWELRGRQLFLVGLTGWIPGAIVGLDYLFPGETAIFSHWFSGRIRIKPTNGLAKWTQANSGLSSIGFCLDFREGILMKGLEELNLDWAAYQSGIIPQNQRVLSQNRRPKAPKYQTAIKQTGTV